MNSTQFKIVMLIMFSFTSMFTFMGINYLYGGASIIGVAFFFGLTVSGIILYCSMDEQKWLATNRNNYKKE